MVVLCVFLMIGVVLQNHGVVSLVSTQGTVYRTANTTQQDVLSNTVLLGALFPVHSSGRGQACGAVSATAVQLVESMVLAIRQINEDSTLLPNINLAFDIRDTCLSLNYALQQSLDYIQSGTVCSQQLGLGPSSIVGPFTSAISEASANLFGLFEIPQVSYGSSATLLSDPRFTYFFRTIPSDLFQARALVDIVVNFGWEYIILLHSNDLYGNGGIAAFQQELELRIGREPCISVQIALSSQPPPNGNYDEAVRKMNQPWMSNASVVLLFGHSEDAIGIFEAIERAMDNSDFRLHNLTWIGSDSWGDNLPDKFRPMARGMLSTVPQSNLIEEFDTYFTRLRPSNNTNPWFIEYWESQFGCNLDPSPNLETCDVENQSISPQMTNYSQFSLVPLVFDAVYAIAHSVQNLIDTNCPSRDLCADILVNGVLNGTLLRDSILNVSIPRQSLNGKILSFDSNGDVEGSYSVLNLQRTSSNQYSFERVGSWDSQNSLSITEDLIEWVGGADEVPQTSCSMPCPEGQFPSPVLNQSDCCFKCRPCPNNTVVDGRRCMQCDVAVGPGFQPNENRTECVLIPLTYLSWSEPWSIVTIILTSLGIITTTVVIIIFVVFYDHELIKASSRELSAVLFIGLMLCYVVPLFYIAKPSAAICGIRRFGIGVCFAISYSALLVKTNRIYRIFSRSTNSSAKPPLFISPLSQVIITLILASVQGLISIISLAVIPPMTRVESSSTSRELVCASSSVLNVAIALGYNLLLLILCTYFAFLTRKVPANFNEAKFINAAVYSTIIIWLAFVPTFFATSGLGTAFQVISLAAGIIFSATTTLVCLFISKVFLLSSKIRKQKRTEQSGNALSGPSKIFKSTDLPQSIELGNSLNKSADTNE